MIELRKRVPEESLDWLDYIQKLGRWTDLVRCYVLNEPEDQADIRMLGATLAWVEEIKGQKKDRMPATLGSNADGPIAGSDPQNPKS
ncbi:hypothetical protein [Rhizobium ruizarguesonis]|uniref:hypothetical protein n=1 Tax=Rhizobium ruizarguesonis TaxID=2081791 RepID=UPI001031F3B5|nr:hypothetical protein [Rhizobium ruizarguesonis]TAZ51022.1 hypothetical protein ELH76_07485 [Rhizobium ruizarguesonis]